MTGAGSGACTGDSLPSAALTRLAAPPPQRLAPPHSFHLLLLRWCWQRLAPPHSLHSLFRRWCWQMLGPPHSLHVLLRRWCWQMLAPPHSLHSLLRRWCWQMPAPPHSLHVLLLCWCGHRSPLRVAPSAVAPAVAPDRLRRARFAALPPVCVCRPPLAWPRRRSPPPP